MQAGNEITRQNVQNIPQSFIFRAQHQYAMSVRYIFAMVLLLAAALIFSAGCTQQNAPATGSPGAAVEQITMASTASSPSIVSTDTWKRVRLETGMGNITIALDPGTPVTSGNFETLVNKGYYNGVIFHRVIAGFMIQGGDPTGTGRGGPGYVIPDEFPANNHNNRGTIAMANAGPDTGGSQFFINLVNNNYLDNKHPVFGKVVEGMDVVDAIGSVKTSGAPNNRPLQNVTILRAEML